MSGTDRRSAPRSARKRGGRRGPSGRRRRRRCRPARRSPATRRPTSASSPTCASATASASATSRCMPLFGDASTRRYYRVVDARAGLPILSLNPEPFEPESLPFVVIRNLMAGWGLPVPEIVDADGAARHPAAGGPGRPHPAGVPRPARAPSAGGALPPGPRPARACCSARPRAAPQRAGCFQIAFDFEKLSWELHFFWKHFLEGYREARPLGGGPRRPSPTASIASAAEIASWPRVLCHRDFHSRNLMSHRDAAVLDRLPGRAHGPGHLRPRLAAARLLRGPRRGVRGRARGGVPPARGARRVARHLPAALRPHVDPAQPEGAGHLRLHGHGARQPRLPALHPADAGQRAPQPGRATRSWPACTARWRATSRSCGDGDRCASSTSADHVGEEVHVQGWLHNKRSQRQAAVPDRARRQRLRAGGDGQGGGAAGGLAGRGGAWARSRRSSSRAR